MPTTFLKQILSGTIDAGNVNMMEVATKMVGAELDIDVP